jgi:RNA polymerase sigma factor (sigma-70 family)
MPLSAVLAQRWDLLTPHADRLRRLVRSRLGNSADVEDCVQETMIRAASFANLDENRIGAFLTATALRICVDHYRDRDRQLRLQRRLAFTDGSATPEEAVCERQLGSWLLSRVHHLPTRERDIILARATGMSTRQAAHHHRISLKAAESAFTRGRSRLRAELERGLAEAS